MAVTRMAVTRMAVTRMAVTKMAMTRMAVIRVVVTRSLMTARMTSVLMGAVTAVMTRWSRTLLRTELMILKVAISTGISTTYFIAIIKNKYFI